MNIHWFQHVPFEGLGTIAPWLSAEIVSGLAEGDMVITHPDDAIDDGSRVRLRDGGRASIATVEP
jgi:hypothetical protein